MSYIPDAGADYGALPGADYGALPGADYGAGQNDEPLNLGPNIFLAKPGDLPPEAFKSATPTVQHLPDKVVKNTLPPQYKTENLPPKYVKTRVAPIFPPGHEATDLNLNLPNV